jgi:hypothetical protein
MNHYPPVNKTAAFKPPTSFTTMIKDGKKDKNLWALGKYLCNLMIIM